MYFILYLLIILYYKSYSISIGLTMKTLLRYFLLLVLTLINYQSSFSNPVVFHDHPNHPVVELQVELKNQGKNARVFYNNIQRPFKFPNDGKISFLAHRSDTVKLEIHNIGYKKINIALNLDKISFQKKQEQGKPLTHLITIDYKYKSYYGKVFEKNVFFEMIPLEPVQQWMVGNVLDKESKKFVHDATVYFVNPFQYSIHKNESVRSNSKGGFCIPVFWGGDQFLVVEKEGYFPTIEFSEFVKPENRISYGTQSYSLDQVEINRQSLNQKSISFVAYDRHNQNIEPIRNITVVKNPDLKKIKLKDNFYFTELVSGNEIFDLGLFHSEKGFNRITATLDNSFVFYDILYDPESGSAIVSDCGNFFKFFRLENHENWNYKNITRMMKGNSNFAGTIINKETGKPVKNVKVTLNENEWITYTDESGCFYFKKIQNKNFTFQLTRKGYFSNILRINPGIPPSFPIQLVPIPNYRKSAIEGVLISYETLEPLVKKTLFLTGTPHHTTTDANGYFQFSNLPEGDYCLSTSSNSRMDYNFYLPPDSTISEELYLKHNLFLVQRKRTYYGKQGYTLPKGSLSGNIRLNNSDEVLEGVYVFIEGSRKMTTTNRYGSFMFANLKPGYYNLIVQSDQHKTLHVDSIHHEPNKPQLLNLELQKPLFFKKPKHVVDNVKPPYSEDAKKSTESKSYIVSFEKKPKNIMSKIFGTIRGKDLQYGLLGAGIFIEGLECEFRSRLGGAFEIDSLKRGKYKLEIVTPRFSPATREIEVGENEWIEVEFYLEKDEDFNPGSWPYSKAKQKFHDDKLKSEGVIVSQTQHPNGKNSRIIGNIHSVDPREAIIGANIIVEGTRKGAASDLEGDFFIFEMKGGKYTVKASSIGYLPATIEIDLGPNDLLELEFSLEEDPNHKPSSYWGHGRPRALINPYYANKSEAYIKYRNNVEKTSASKIMGEVVDKMSGEPIIGATIVIKKSALRATSGLDGELAFLSMKDGDYVLKATAKDYLPVEIEIVLGKNEVVFCRFVLDRPQ